MKTHFSSGNENPRFSFYEYIYLYETITGESFPFPDQGMTVHERINKNLEGLL